MDSEIIRIVLADGRAFRHPDISQETFTEYLLSQGIADLEYARYCKERGMKSLSRFNSETTKDLTLVFEYPYVDRVLKFRCTYDSDADENFDPEEYFVSETTSTDGE